MSVKGTIAILTGGGDVPGLNPAIRAVTLRAIREGYRVLGIRRGWGGLVDLVPDEAADNSYHVQVLNEEIVDRVGRTEEHSCTPRGLDRVIYQSALCRRISKKNTWLKSMMLRRRC